MRTKTSSIPHRNLIKILILAGIPIVSDKTGITCVTDILYDYEFNIHPSEDYKEIEDELKSEPAESVMIDKNSSLYRSNYAIKNKSKRKDIYIDKAAMDTYYMPHVAIDLMHKFHGISHKHSKQSIGIIQIMAQPGYRQIIEVMLTRGVPFGKIASALNDKPNPMFKLTHQDIALYHYYIWKWSPLEESMGEPLAELYNYIFINNNSSYYKVHRTLLHDMDLDEILVHMGSYGEDERNYINKKLFGLSSTSILRKLRANERVPSSTLQIYAHADSSISADKQKEDMDSLSKRIDDLFSSVSFVGEKRRTMSEIMSGYKPGEDSEQDEPAEISRLKNKT